MQSIKKYTFFVLLLTFVSINNSLAQEILTDSGIKKEILKEGKGEKAKKGQTVKIKLKGELTNGYVFDDGVMSFEIGDPQMIPGFNKVLPTMKKGEKVIITLPPNEGYGEKSISEDDEELIPANSTLIFEIYLINIK